MSCAPESQQQQLLSSGGSLSQHPSETCIPAHAAMLLSNLPDLEQQPQHINTAGLATEHNLSSMQQATVAQGHVQQAVSEARSQPEDAPALPCEHAGPAAAGYTQTSQPTGAAPRRRGRPRKNKAKQGRPPNPRTKATPLTEAAIDSFDVPIELSADHPILQGLWQEVLLGGIHDTGWSPLREFVPLQAILHTRMPLLL